MTFSEQLAFTNENNRFMRFCGIRITALTEELCTAELNLAEHHRNTGEYAHGGLLFTLADCTVSAFARAVAGTAVTLSSDFRYHANVRSGIVTARAEPVKLGRTILVFHVVIESAGKLLAEGTFSCFHRG